MFNSEKALLRKIFKNNFIAIQENLQELIAYANANLVLDRQKYLEKNPELKALPFDIILHALLWGFIEGRADINTKNELSFRNIQFFSNSFHSLSNAYFFDKNYILAQLGEESHGLDYIDAVCTYSKCWLEDSAINPNRYFNTAYTASQYGITSNSRQSPAAMFLLGADVNETFQGGGLYKRVIRRENPPRRKTPATTKKQKLFFLSHGAGRTGACLNAFYSAAALYDIGFDVILLYVQEGDLEEEMRSRLPSIKVDSPEHFKRIAQEACFTHGVVNTITLGSYIEVARELSIPTITLIHEWSTSVISFGWSASAKSVAESSTKIICSSSRGRSDFLSTFPESSSKTYVLPQGDYLGNEKQFQQAEPAIFKWLRERFAKIVIISGYFDTRKGFDLLPHLIIECNKIEKGHFCFVHIGEAAPHLAPWVQADLQKSGCDEQVYFLGKVTNPLAYFTNADAMALPSREDPLPTVVMEAVNSRLPVVIFDKSTGFTPQDYAAEFEDGLISQAKYLDMPDFAQKLHLATKIKPARPDQKSFDFNEYVKKLSRHISEMASPQDEITLPPKESPGVTAVVIFHNQARYAWVRLLSIAQQSEPPKQLIIVDDASTDNILADLEILISSLRSRIPDIKLIRNVPANAGRNTIVNLLRILDVVSNEWIWICEGDDFCMPDFLKNAASHLIGGVSLYYSDSLICNDEGFTVADYSDYYAQLRQTSSGEVTGAVDKTKIATGWRLRTRFQTCQLLSFQKNACKLSHLRNTVRLLAVATGVFIAKFWKRAMLYSIVIA